MLVIRILTTFLGLFGLVFLAFGILGLLLLVARQVPLQSWLQNPRAGSRWFRLASKLFFAVAGMLISSFAPQPAFSMTSFSQRRLEAAERKSSHQLHRLQMSYRQQIEQRRMHEQFLDLLGEEQKK